MILQVRGFPNPQEFPTGDFFSAVSGRVLREQALFGLCEFFQFSEFFLNKTSCKNSREVVDHVDGRNLANQLRLVVYPMISKVFYISGGAGFLNHQQYVGSTRHPAKKNTPCNFPFTKPKYRPKSHFLFLLELRRRRREIFRGTSLSKA